HRCRRAKGQPAARRRHRRARRRARTECIPAPRRGPNEDSPCDLPYHARVQGLADEIRRYTSVASFGRVVVLLLLGIVMEVGVRSGTVEEITMRITVLRGVDGAMIVIPNGTITAVSNMTSAWARVIVDVGVAYTTNLDTAVGVLSKVAKGMHAEEAWGRLML